MMPVRAKKVILFIVEGATDENALGPILKKIFHRQDIRFHVVRGDMTSDSAVSGHNVVKTVYQHIEIERKRYGFEKRDIMQVIHLVDTDGAFIPDESIVMGLSESIKYLNDRIETKAPDKIVERNKRKSQVLQKICSTRRIGTIAYQVYYFSRNREHVFHNCDGYLTDNEKIEYADAFANQYQSDPQGFIAFISSGAFTVSGEYKETWQFIMYGHNSLQRYSNFHLLFGKA